jgi:hypothetical protein
MPGYRAPGVFVEDVSVRARTIEGVETTTTGFVGPTRYGPLDARPEVVTSLVEYERIYGGKAKLAFSNGDGETDDYMWNAARAFFQEGGTRLYVARAFTPTSTLLTGMARVDPASAGGRADLLDLGVRARFPGRAGDARVTFTLQLGPNRLTRGADGAVSIAGAAHRDIVWVRDAVDTRGTFFRLIADPLGQTWQLDTGTSDDPGTMTELQARFPAPQAPAQDVLDLRILTVTVTVAPASGDLATFVAADLPLDPHHVRDGVPDSLFACFAEEPTRSARTRSVPIVLDRAAGDGLDVLARFVAAHDAASAAPTLAAALADRASPAAARSVTVALSGGDDGAIPTLAAYEGAENPDTGRATGLRALEAVEDIAIVAAPGSTATGGARTQSIVAALIGHAERMRYRIAVVDSVRGQTIEAVRAFRALFDSSHAALYYPWVRTVDPLTGQENIYPPSGFVVGIYARNDVERAVYKAPANAVVRLATGFERLISHHEQDVLNPEGINCFRFFAGRGMRLWGARTMSRDSESKYVNVRRYVAYLERSIDRGLQWTVFEPNGERLWANVRRTVEDFLLGEWRKDGLLGDQPSAYFVKCDRSTMTRNDLDNGRLVCLIGVAVVKPAEFVILRIGQWTADRKTWRRLDMTDLRVRPKT